MIFYDVYINPKNVFSARVSTCSDYYIQGIEVLINGVIIYSEYSRLNYQDIILRKKELEKQLFNLLKSEE